MVMIGMWTENHECIWQLRRAGALCEWKPEEGTRWLGGATSPSNLGHGAKIRGKGRVG